MTRLRWLLLAALVLPGIALPARAAAPPRPMIEVVVRFTVKEFDPRGKKDGALEVVVVNHSDRPVRVPTGYADRFDSDIIVFGRVGTEKKTTEKFWYYWDLRLFARTSAGAASSKVSQATVAPGKEMVVFKEGLNELLLERKKSGWDWQA